jgi:hypothetical protein
MTCQNCKSPDCTAQFASQLEALALELLDETGRNDHLRRWQLARDNAEQAQSDCAHRAAHRTNADTLARLADIEARQDRIEAVLRAKGWM